MRGKTKLIIVDLYGVMTTGNYHNICAWLAKKYHRTERDVYKIVYHKYFNLAALGKITEKESFEKALQDLGMTENWREIRARHLEYLLLNKQVFAYVLGLQKQGFKILLLSKNVPSQFRDIVSKYKLRKYFKNIINTYDLGLPKASKETINFVLKKFKVKPQEIIYIDDQDFNLPIAKKLGVKTILYKNFSETKKKLIKYLN
jgi:HAD superfamily hydrolase (TIGR01509 family)